jgi:hypothetical protein
VAGLFTWLIAYRILIRVRNVRDEPPAWALLALTVVVCALTFAAEAVGIGLAFHVSPLMVLEMAFDFDIETIRPGWFVLGAGLCVVALDVVRAWWRRPRTRAGKPVPVKPVQEAA